MEANCDVWLLTEVPCSFEMQSGNATFSQRMGASDKAYAAVWGTVVDDLSLDIHPTAALRRVGDWRVCSCVLPWRFAPSQASPVEGATRRSSRGDSSLREGLADQSGDLVLGGDWNQAFEGRDHVGTLGGRAALHASLQTLDLALTTAGLDKHTDKGEHRSMDHIAVPKHWKPRAAQALVAETDDGVRLSDHDAYLIDVEA